MKIQEKFDLTGKAAIVTGGVGLLGTEFCRTLAEAGAAVAVADLNAEKSAVVAGDLAKAGYKALGVGVDITNPDSVNAMVSQVVAAFGRIDEMAQVEKAQTLAMGWCLDCHRQPEKFLRPRDQVTSMTYKPKGDQLALGRQLKEQYHVETRTSCTTCHR